MNTSEYFQLLSALAPEVGAIALERIGSGTATKYALDYDRQLSAKELADRSPFLPSTGNNDAPVPF